MCTLLEMHLIKNLSERHANKNLKGYIHILSHTNKTWATFDIQFFVILQLFAYVSRVIQFERFNGHNIVDCLV